MTTPFCASIETTEGVSHQHGFHLGTDEHLARELCESLFRERITSNRPVRTIGLMRDGKLVDCFYGDRWHWDEDHD